MDNNDPPKPRRPLPAAPIAVPAQRPNTPNTPIQLHAPIPAASFYATAPHSAPPAQSYSPRPPPPLPSRPRDLGSKHTAYVPPHEPPRYNSPAFNVSPAFREPELITIPEAPLSARPPHDDDIPDLVPQQQPVDDRGWTNNPAWDAAATNWSKERMPTWQTPGTRVEDWEIPQGSSGFDPMDYLASSTVHKGDPMSEVAIDGRDVHEELNWWNPDERRRAARPGPGMLPPVLAEELHDPEHSLYSVNISLDNLPKTSWLKNPELVPPAPISSTTSLAGSSVPTPATSAGPAQPAPPSHEEIRTAVPHPNAYYCPKDNGWVILAWKSSSMAPPLARSFLASTTGAAPPSTSTTTSVLPTPPTRASFHVPHPLPDQDRRKRTASCIGGDGHPFGPSNKTHHMHKYARAVDAHKLTPPFRMDDWEAAESRKLKRRGGTIVLDEFDFDAVKKQGEVGGLEDPEEEQEEEGKLLDLYMCCQCSFYIVASGVIPAVIPKRHFDEFIKDKKANPPVGKTSEQAVCLALETFLLAIENKLWKGEKRMIKINNPTFQSKLGWNTNVKRVFEILGFTQDQPDGDQLVIRPPNTDINTPAGRQMRRKLLRAWVEIGAWLVDMKRIYASQFKEMKNHPLYVQLDSAREMYQTAVGAHPEQIPRGELNDTLMVALRPLREAWHTLGLTPMSYSADLLAFAYLAQCRCDPARTVTYFTHFSSLVRTMQDYASCPQALQDLLAMERSRERFTQEDLARAAQTLGFGPEGELRVDYDDEEIPDDFVENAWKECVRRSWRDPVRGAEMHREANEAFGKLAEARGSVRLKKAWEMGKGMYMNPDRAYDTLEIPRDVDDNMLITVFNMRLEETPLQMDKMREALLVIAEVRDSERLRQFLATGQDPGDIIAPTRPDLPRGLNQLGNTCYLNSLLQYFYTIKDLREAVAPMSKLDLNSLVDEKLTDDELKRHRVGGRLVTRREIVRSKKFINQLAELFLNLEYAEAAAVTPSVELAKLALVTSRDEEEDEADSRGTDSSSNDTDATLVEDGPSRALPPSPSRSSCSVLGKRPRDGERQSSLMDVDSSQPPEKEGYIMVESPRSSSSPPPLEEVPEASSSSQQIIDVDMRDTPAPQKPQAPPLPSRKTSDSVMMFGRQHDVAECMDNCMFQIETALLKFNGMSDSAEGSDKTSVVKRLFYGKIRQRLTGISGPQPSRSSIHEKEDLFSHLPVNVADSGIDIYDGLSHYFDDVVEYEGRKARMEVSLVDVPPLLQIQLQRVQFNRDTLQPYKSQAYVKFGETIYMDRFMDNADPQKKSRSKAIQAELTACRDRVRLLVEGKEEPFLSALEHTGNFLSKLEGDIVPGVDIDLVLSLRDEQKVVRDEIDQLRVRADQLKDELEALWRDNTDVAYQLTSVFIHRGSSPSWGHYFFYSRHLPEAPDSWFKYNDSDVTVVSKEEVLADTTGSTANPYLLVFARKGSQVVDTVKRFDSSQLEQDS